jgi:hypothetical protein
VTGLDIAVASAGFAIIAASLVQLTMINNRLGRIDQSLRLLSTATPPAGGVAVTNVDEPSPDDLPAYLRTGILPEWIDHPGHNRGKWNLILGVRKGCGVCERVLGGVAAVRSSMSDYNVLLVTDMGPIEGWSTVRPTDDCLDAAPFIVLADPARHVKGQGFPSGAEDVLDFLSEGSTHGFGPGPNVSDLRPEHVNQ